MKNKWKKLITVLMILVNTFCIFARTSPDAAKKYYDEDNYIKAAEEYKKYMRKNLFSGKDMYRYTYSMENINGLTDDVLDLYSLTFFLLNKEKNEMDRAEFKENNEVYYNFTKRKLENNAEDKINISKRTYRKLFRKYIVDGNIFSNLAYSIGNIWRHYKSFLFDTPVAAMVILFLLSLVLFGFAELLEKNDKDPTIPYLLVALSGISKVCIVWVFREEILVCFLDICLALMCTIVGIAVIPFFAAAYFIGLKLLICL